jgi:hypothetical protein
MIDAPFFNSRKHIFGSTNPTHALLEVNLGHSEIITEGVVG